MDEIENLYRIARNDSYSDTHRDLAARAIARAGRPHDERTIALSVNWRSLRSVVTSEVETHDRLGEQAAAEGNDHGIKWHEYRADALRSVLRSMNTLEELSVPGLAEHTAPSCRCGHPQSDHYEDGSPNGGGCDATQIGDAPVRCRCKGFAEMSDALAEHTAAAPVDPHENCLDPCCGRHAIDCPDNPAYAGSAAAEFQDCSCGKRIYRGMDGNWHHWIDGKPSPACIPALYEHTAAACDTITKAAQ